MNNGHPISDAIAFLVNPAAVTVNALRNSSRNNILCSLRHIFVGGQSVSEEHSFAPTSITQSPITTNQQHTGKRGLFCVEARG